MHLHPWLKLQSPPSLPNFPPLHIHTPPLHPSSTSIHIHFHIHPPAQYHTILYRLQTYSTTTTLLHTLQTLHTLHPKYTVHGTCTYLSVPYLHNARPARA